MSDRAEPLLLVGASVWKHDVKLDIDFPTQRYDAVNKQEIALTEADLSPVYLLHGANGFGKTTLLQSIQNTSDALVGDLNPLPLDQFDACELLFFDGTQVSLQRCLGLVRIGVSEPQACLREQQLHERCPPIKSIRSAECKERGLSDTAREFRFLTYDSGMISVVRRYMKQVRTASANSRADQAMRFQTALRTIDLRSTSRALGEQLDGFDNFDEKYSWLESWLDFHSNPDNGGYEATISSLVRTPLFRPYSRELRDSRELHGLPSHFAPLDSMFAFTKGNHPGWVALDAGFPDGHGDTHLDELTLQLLQETAQRFDSRFESADRLVRRRHAPHQVGDGDDFRRFNEQVDLVQWPGSFEASARTIRDEIWRAGLYLEDSPIIDFLKGLSETQLSEPRHRETPTSDESHEPTTIDRTELRQRVKSVASTAVGLEKFGLIQITDFVEQLAAMNINADDESEFGLNVDLLSDEQVQSIGQLLEIEQKRLDHLAPLRYRLELFSEFVEAGLKPDTRVRVDAESGYEILRSRTNHQGADERDAVVVAPWQLSSGNQHRLSLAFSTLFETPQGGLLMIDEPEISLDVQWQSSLVEDLLNMAHARDITLILSTHAPMVTTGHIDLLVPPL